MVNQVNDKTIRPTTIILDTYQRMDGKEIRIPRETGSRSGAMESHGKPPY